MRWRVAAWAVAMAAAAFLNTGAFCGIEGQFVLSLAECPDGTLLAGTEGGGLLAMRPDGDWRQDESFPAVGGKSVFALAVDGMGRIWAGTLDRGVCVNDGDGWSSFGIEKGLPGNRVFAVSAADNGDVWLATDGGVSFYEQATGTLRNFGRWSGLPANEARALATDGRGNVYVGFECAGIAFALKAEKFSGWRKFEAPWRFGPASKHETPLAPAGSGLPSNLVNALCADPSGLVWAGTDAGLACTKKDGRWRFIRGREYLDLVNDSASGKPRNLRKEANAAKLLPEDYVTAIVAAGDGKHVFAGLRESGIVAVDAVAMTVSAIWSPGSRNAAEGRITSLLLAKDGSLYAGTYGAGVVKIEHGLKPGRAKRQVSAKKCPVVISTVEEPVTADSGADKVRECVYYRDDWSTKGDWCGRYGMRDAVLCAMIAPWDDHYITRDPLYETKGSVGPHAREGEALRHWVHWAFTENMNSLYDPQIGCRRQAEWDDHSESYPKTFDGPDLWVDVSMPEGMHEIAFYFNNKDAHERQNFRRDYLIEAYRKGDSNVLARARVVGFWNGVYKRFAVASGGRYSFRIKRNGSYSTILSGVFTSRFMEKWEDPAMPRLSTFAYYGGVVYSPPAASKPEIKPVCSPCSLDLHESKLRADYRKALGLLDADASLLERRRWQLRIWNNDDRQRFADTMLLAWTGVQYMEPESRLSAGHAHSPNVYNGPLVQEDYGCRTADRWLKRPDLKNRKEVKIPFPEYFRSLHGMKKIPDPLIGDE